MCLFVVSRFVCGWVPSGWRNGEIGREGGLLIGGLRDIGMLATNGAHGCASAPVRVFVDEPTGSGSGVLNGRDWPALTESAHGVAHEMRAHLTVDVEALCPEVIQPSGRDVLFRAAQYFARAHWALSLLTTRKQVAPRPL